MASSTFILTSSPFLVSQITLASFVPNIQQPHQDAKRPYAIKEFDYSVQPDDAFDGLISTESKKFLQILATRFAAFSLHRDRSNMLQVQAQRGNIYSLDNPNNLFEEMVFGQETAGNIQEWFDRCKRIGLQPRFVVAYRTFIDAKVSRTQHRGTDVSGKGTVPISTVQFDPSGLADVELAIGSRTNGDEKGDMKTPGERIYAICYRKVIIPSRKGKATPVLEPTNKWKPFAGKRGEPDGDLQFDVLDKNDGEEFDIYEIDNTRGEEIRFGVPTD